MSSLAHLDSRSPWGSADVVCGDLQKRRLVLHRRSVIASSVLAWRRLVWMEGTPLDRDCEPAKRVKQSTDRRGALGWIASLATPPRNVDRGACTFYFTADARLWRIGPYEMNGPSVVIANTAQQS